MSEDPKQPYIGGQAVIEGVMMRAPGCLSVAVRKPDGAIAVREGPVVSKLARSKAWKLPFVRGVATLVESLSIGYGALRFSAEQQLTEEERAEAGAGSGRGMMVVTTLIALGLFMAAPQLAAEGTSRLLGVELAVDQWQFHALTGAFKLLIFTLYLFGISRLPDVRRVFQYHGAEHKTIFAYEAGLPLTVSNVQKQSTLHPRCGTTFLVVVIFVSVVAGTFVTPLFMPAWATGRFEQNLITLMVRIALLPPVAAISYELQRVSARYCTTGPLQVLLWPGFLFQKITTREPADDQVEIAITAMRAAIWREQNASAAADDEPLVFESFEGFLEDVETSLRPREA
ncbi:MAG: DUF1385 domain-containing protein [Sandaracinaceae bacterium]|nr:DUF1385 domain-containing protein [Sandaracinaceae bacterium]